MIHVECQCGKQLEVDDKYAGKRGKCPACGRPIDIPETWEAADNLYDVPMEVVPERRRRATADASPLPESGFTKQVPILAVLVIVQGALEMLTFGVAVFGRFMQEDQIQRGLQQNQPFGPPPLPIGLSIVMFVGIMLMPGVLKMISGVLMYQWRNRTLGIIALASSILSVFSCFCAPTGIALAIYGLIVLLNRDVAARFEQVARERG